MILSGSEILRRMGEDIEIEPFNQSQLNPNSYNLTLHNELMVYEEVVLDMAKANRVRRIEIPTEGLVLSPNQLYLGRTAERTVTHNLVPQIEGRSSVGRLGLFVHVTAGFGDVGFAGYWTLEIFAVQPVRIYPGRQSARSSTMRSPERSKSTPPSTNTTTISNRACSSKNSTPTERTTHRCRSILV